MEKLVKDLNKNEVGRDKSTGNYFIGEKKYYYSEDEKNTTVEVLEFENDSDNFFTFDTFLNGGGIQVSGNSHLLERAFAKPKSILIMYEGERNRGDGCYWNIVEYMGKDDAMYDGNISDRFDVIGTVVTRL